MSEKQVDGDSVEVFFEASDDAAVARAAHIVTVLRTAGYPAQDVVLLGHRRRENSSVKDSNAIGGWRLRDTSSAGVGELAYSTIHSFKGLERPVVIVIDAGASGSDETELVALRRDVPRARAALRHLPRRGSRQDQSAHNRLGSGTNDGGSEMIIGKKAATPTEVRQSVLDALRSELVGPSPGYPLVQLNGEGSSDLRIPRATGTLAKSFFHGA